MIKHLFVLKFYKEKLSFILSFSHAMNGTIQDLPF